MTVLTPNCRLYQPYENPQETWAIIFPFEFLVILIALPRKNGYLTDSDWQTVAIRVHTAFKSHFVQFL